MDINSMLSSGEPAGANRPSQSSSPVSQRQAPPPLYHHPSTNGHSQPPPLSHHPSQQTTPQYAPPSQDFRSPSSSMALQGNKGLASLQTPTQQHGQHPFPQSISQSPVTGMPGQQYPPYAGQAATTPGGRPASYGYQQQPPTPSQYGPSGIPQGFQQHHPSHSPTPPSHHSHTPHSVRQSPMTAFMPAPQPPHPHQLQHQQSQHSQPGTPLGPPSLQHQRTSGFSNSHPDPYSPYHQRNFSSASNGILSGSPAQPHNMAESPSAYSRQSSQPIRRTSDYLNHLDRERSLSVSPKTKVPPRVPSQGSRHSSVQESFSTRSSTQHSQSHSVVAQQPPEAQSHVVAQPQTPSFTAPLSSESVAHHHSQKMGMNHLLTPAHERTRPDDDMAGKKHVDPFMPRAPRVPEAAAAPQVHVKIEDSTTSMADAPPTLRNTPLATEPAPQQERAPGHVTQSASDFPAQPPHPINATSCAPGKYPSSQTHTTATESMMENTRKRPAVEEISTQPPKRECRRRTRPIWARLHPSNPRCTASPRQGGPESQHVHQQQHEQKHTMPSASQPPQANGSTPPWELDPPLDHDLIAARSALGEWEKTFKWNTPYPDMLRSLQDWLCRKLAENAEVGNNAATGAIEIEAKIGTLSEEATGDRVRLPVSTIGLIHPNANKHYRFESRMGEAEHQAMNQFLNSTTQESRQPGRIHMQYAHKHETDSFATLSAAGYAALPEVARTKPRKHELRLRTTRDSRTGQVLARIVKIPLGNIHIYNPNELYDCRISMNLEVSLDRPDLDFEALVKAPSEEKELLPSRKKDRLSYKHLCYSVDLTKVEVSGLAQPKYELELEMDPGKLREQMGKQSQGQPNGVADVVSGFLDNACFLMKQRPMS